MGTQRQAAAPGGPSGAKERLRRAMRGRLRALPDGYAASAGQAIERRALELEEYGRARSVFVYVSMPNEPPTREIVRRALEVGKAVYVPKCEGGRMLAVRISGPEELAAGSFGIPEPARAAETARAEEIGLAFVPCLAASADGRRLGRGGGYYDRFLAGGCATVCLCFAKMLSDGIPMEGTDAWMDMVLTEKGLYRPGRPRGSQDA